MKKIQPFGVTLLAMLVLSLSALNLVRFGSALFQWNILEEFAPRPGPLYILLTGLLWTLIGFPLFLGLWRGMAWARRATIPAVAFYAIFYWFDRLYFQNREAPNNWIFALIATIVWLIFATIVVTHPNIRMFFSVEPEKVENNELDANNS